MTFYIRYISVIIICLAAAAFGQSNLIDVDEVFVEQGDDYIFDIYAYLSDPYSGFEIPLTAFSSDFVFDSASLFGSVVPSNFEIGWNLNNDSSQMILFIFPPATITELIESPGGKLCEVYFHVRPEAFSQIVFIDTTTFDIYSPDSSTVIVSYELSGYDENGAFKIVDFEAGIVDITITVDVEDELEGNLPGQFRLYQNRPNPFNPSTRIAYSLPVDSYVTLTVYDILGRQVKVLDEGYRQAGTHLVTFEASDYATGFYFAHFQAREYSETKRMLLLK